MMVVFKPRVLIQCEESEGNSYFFAKYGLTFYSLIFNTLQVCPSKLTYQVVNSLCVQEFIQPNLAIQWKRAHLGPATK